MTRLIALGAGLFVGFLSLAPVLAEVPSTQPGQVLVGLPARAVDLKGEVHNLRDRPTAIVLLGTECPIARRAVATLNELRGQLEAEGVFLVGLLSDPTVTRARAAAFALEYGASFPVLFDGSGQLALFLQPRRTPEAFLIDAQGNIRYRGRIDNGYESLGKPRAVVTQHDLKEAALALARGEAIATPVTEPVGCTFEPRKMGDAASPVTYHRDIAPLLAANCVSCHKQGQVAPFTLTSYEDASKRATLLAEVTASRYMPPWHARPQPHRFADERRLSEGEIELFQRWAKAGAPEGDKADALPALSVAASPWRLGTPDLIVEMPRAFNVPASGRDLYRAFPISVNVPEDSYVVASEFQPGDASVVHHALLFLDASGTARQKEAASHDGQPGYVSFGGPGFIPASGLGGWAPGSSPAFLPDGVGKPLRKGWDVVMQLHYHPDGKPHADRSRIGIYLAKKPITKVAVSIPLMSRQIDIPAGDSHYTREMSLTLPRQVEIISVMPHMHLLGRSMSATATLPSGVSMPLIDVPEWDFRWQDQYRYAEPLMLPAGTKISATATYDNSDQNPANPSNPPQRVRFGEQTTDEMCLIFFQIIVGKDSPLANRGQGQRAGGGLLQRLRQRAQ